MILDYSIYRYSYTIIPMQYAHLLLCLVAAAAAAAAENTTLRTEKNCWEKRLQMADIYNLPYTHPEACDPKIPSPSPVPIVAQKWLRTNCERTCNSKPDLQTILMVTENLLRRLHPHNPADIVHHERAMRLLQYALADLQPPKKPSDEVCTTCSN